MRQLSAAVGTDAIPAAFGAKIMILCFRRLWVTHVLGYWQGDGYDLRREGRNSIVCYHVFAHLLASGGDLS